MSFFEEKKGGKKGGEKGGERGKKEKIKGKKGGGGKGGEKKGKKGPSRPFLLTRPLNQKQKFCLVWRYDNSDLSPIPFQGENRFIESICQTIFSADELLDIMNNSSIENNLKRPYVRFLLWVYLNTAGGMLDSGQGDLNHDR